MPSKKQKKQRLCVILRTQIYPKDSMMTNEALLSAIEKQAKSIYSNLTTDELVQKSLERGEGKLTDRGALA